jgi:hypothetical protein
MTAETYYIYCTLVSLSIIIFNRLKKNTYQR